MKLKKTNSFQMRVIQFFPILCIFALTACQSIAPLDKSSMTMGFGEAAFGMGIESKGRHAAIYTSNLVRWNTDKPVQLIITGEPEESILYKQIVSQLQKLYQVASIDLQSIPIQTTQKLSVEISNETLLDYNGITAPCYANWDKNEDGYLTEASIVITRNSLLNETGCLLHEGMHSLGFGGHPHRLNSILSYTNDVVNLTNVDEQLIQLLYSDNYKVKAPIGDVLTTVYSKLSRLPEQKEKRYPPRDISLQLSLDESPLVLSPPFLDDASKEFYYQGEENGASTIQAVYGARGAGGEFADVVHRKLSTNHIFLDRTKLSELVYQYDSTFGKASIRNEGYANHESGFIKYAITDSSKYSCAFTIKYINALTKGVGGHQVMYGYYCRNSEDPITAEDANKFVSSIQMLDRNPIKIRSTRIDLEEKKNQKFSAVRLTGKWPLDGSYVSGFKLIVKGDVSGVIKVNIGKDICNGTLERTGTLRSGDWELKCDSNENSRGRYTINADESINFLGQTNATKSKIDWTGYRVF